MLLLALALLEASAATDAAAIEITINPEARVSAQLTGPIPTGICGVPIAMAVKIANQAYVTSSLAVALAGEIPTGVIVELEPVPLTGRQEEYRRLHITLASPSTLDLTLAFSLARELGDLGGRDRVHFLMNCSPP